MLCEPLNIKTELSALYRIQFNPMLRHHNNWKTITVDYRECRPQEVKQQYQHYTRSQIQYTHTHHSSHLSQWFMMLTSGFFVYFPSMTGTGDFGSSNVFSIDLYSTLQLLDLYQTWRECTTGMWRGGRQRRRTSRSVSVTLICESVHDVYVSWPLCFMCDGMLSIPFCSSVRLGWFVVEGRTIFKN